MVYLCKIKIILYNYIVLLIQVPFAGGIDDVKHCHRRELRLKIYPMSTCMFCLKTHSCIIYAPITICILSKHPHFYHTCFILQRLRKHYAFVYGDWMDGKEQKVRRPKNNHIQHTKPVPTEQMVFSFISTENEPLTLSVWL